MATGSFQRAGTPTDFRRTFDQEADTPPSRSILIVTPAWPSPPTWGFAVRVYQLARQLAARHRVTVLAYSGGNATGEERFGSWFTTAELVPRPAANRSKRRSQIASLLSPHSYHMNHLRSGEMRRAITRLLHDRVFDIVQVESSQLASMVPDCDTPIVLDEHNVEFKLLDRIADNETGARRWFGQLEAAKARREELSAWARADGVVFTSQADLSVMHRIDPGKRAKVVANGVDVEHFAPASGPPDADLIVFTGSINYRPNTDAVDYFNRAMFPQVRRVRPSARFVVVGQGAPEWLVRTAPPGVEFTGYVPDIRPYLERAAVVVVPLRSGSGTRLKILEALATARPVVSTTVGCEGLSVVDGQHVSIVDEPDQFAREVTSLMSDPLRSNELGQRGRELVVANYSWHIAGQRLERFHTQLIGKETKV